MHADIIVAGESATFGQPEVRVVIMPGAGGTQRLTRAVGKFKAMLICMAGQTFSGREAFEMGLASTVKIGNASCRKEWSVRVDLGGSRIIHKKKQNAQHN